MAVKKQPAPFLTLRNNEFSGDMAAWALETSMSNEEQLERLHKNLRLARQMVLTQRQQMIMTLYYDEGLRMSEIARQLHINRATVSRHLSRGRERLKRYLRYSF